MNTRNVFTAVICGMTLFIGFFFGSIHNRDYYEGLRIEANYERDSCKVYSNNLADKVDWNALTSIELNNIISDCGKCEPKKRAALDNLFEKRKTYQGVRMVKR